MGKIKNVLRFGKNFLIRFFTITKRGIGKTLIILGETEKDDKVITVLSKGVLLSAQQELFGSTPLNSAMLDEIFKKAFEVINAKEVKIGKKLMGS